MHLAAVLLKLYETPPREKLSALFQAVCGWSKIDATTKAARAHGIVAEQLMPDVAARLHSALTRLGCETAVFPQSRLVPEVRSRRVQLVIPETQRLGIRWGLAGEPQWYNWSDVAIVSAGVVFRQESRQVIETKVLAGVSAGNSGPFAQTETVVKRRDASHDAAMATLTLGKSLDQLEHVRLRAQGLEYASILGDNLQPFVLSNFCLVLARIGLRSTEAHITHETSDFIEASSDTPRLPQHPRFESEAEFDNYQRWLATWRFSTNRLAVASTRRGWPRLLANGVHRKRQFA